jgi:hypothetical protein
MFAALARRRRSKPGQAVVCACAWCRRVRLGKWVPLETALARLRVERLEDAGIVTHGICDDCLAVQLEALASRRLAA